MKRGEIYFMYTQGSGSVQAGYRPVIVVQNDIGNHFSPTTIVCSITATRKKMLPTHVDIGVSGGLYKRSTVLCEQIQTVSKRDLRSYVGCISDPRILDKLDKGILISLGLNKEEFINESFRSN